MITLSHIFIPSTVYTEYCATDIMVFTCIVNLDVEAFIMLSSKIARRFEFFSHSVIIISIVVFIITRNFVEENFNCERPETNVAKAIVLSYRVLGSTGGYNSLLGNKINIRRKTSISIKSWIHPFSHFFFHVHPRQLSEKQC